MQTLILVLALAFAQAATTQNTPNTIRLKDGQERPAATVADLAWLAGAWTGEGLGGKVDEVWSAPGAGTGAVTEEKFVYRRVR